MNLETVKQLRRTGYSLKRAPDFDQRKGLKWRWKHSRGAYSLDAWATQGEAWDGALQDAISKRNARRWTFGGTPTAFLVCCPGDLEGREMRPGCVIPSAWPDAEAKARALVAFLNQHGYELPA